MNVAAIPQARMGIFCMLAGMFLISVNDMLIKSLSGGYPLHQLVLLRSCVGLVFTLFLLRLEGGWSLLRTGRPLLHMLRAMLIVFANSMIYAAIVAMPLATANALYFVAPLFVTLLSIPILGEHVGPRRFGAIGLGFAGVLLMMAPQLAGGEDALGWVVVLPVLAAAGYATMSVLTRKLGATSRASALALHMQIAFILVSVTMFLVAGDGRFAEGTQNESIRFLLRAWTWPPAADALPIAMLGLVAAAVGYLMSQAYRLSPASAVAPFEYSLLIYALFWGWTIFGEWPAPMVFLGAAVVIGSGIYVFLREGQRKSPRRV
ncbi:Riboflavin transporter [Sulfitobacter sp. THAF37]|uniref:DMT family transporter n=1 Tax=Sulfitobacter sp. THAF37 TaxID=2587855 RepID=UPI001267C17E|nr:DMT family transporter [Sulfitobacter sp. THAF37]QFT59802.1 Riboflavin transporter [Sulfitobacter sp. THAF37]